MSDDLDVTCPACGVPMRPAFAAAQRVGTERQALERKVFECRRCGRRDTWPCEAGNQHELKPIPTMWPLN
jgi:hypothetical protein